MGDKATLSERVKPLLINPDAIEKIVISGQGIQHEIPNSPNTQSSLQIFSYLTSNAGEINAQEAEKGLEIYGDELRTEHIIGEKKHVNIGILEDIARRGLPVRSDIYRRPEAKDIPFTEEQLREALAEFPTPFIIYSEKEILRNDARLSKAFSWANGFRNHFAFKATPNLDIIDILRRRGQGGDCSSDYELDMARRLGVLGEDVILTSNNTPESLFRMATEQGAIINFDDITHIPFYQQSVGKLPKVACCRFNPGVERAGNSIIGDPVQAKFGMRRDQIFEAFNLLKAGGVERYGLHTMIVSNERNPEYFVETGRMMFKLIGDIRRSTGIEVEFVDLGGGLGTPYRPEQRELDVMAVGQVIKSEFEKNVAQGEIRPDLRILMENGRFITGPSGVLVSRVLHTPEKHKDFIGLDASLPANLFRAGIYGAYHHISFLGKRYDAPVKRYDVVDGLCENMKFTVDRLLPSVQRGEVALIYNAGAHAIAMGSNYNGHRKCAEILLKEDDGLRMIARGQTIDDLNARFKFPGSRFFPQ